MELIEVLNSIYLPIILNKKQKINVCFGFGNVIIDH